MPTACPSLPRLSHLQCSPAMPSFVCLSGKPCKAVCAVDYSSHPSKPATHHRRTRPSHPPRENASIGLPLFSVPLVEEIPVTACKEEALRPSNQWRGCSSPESLHHLVPNQPPWTKIIPNFISTPELDQGTIQQWVGSPCIRSPIPAF